MAVRALWYDSGTLHLLDQRLLPRKTVVLHLTRLGQVADAIRGMAVRGAPSIGVAAAYGMAIAANEKLWSPDAAAKLLGSTRPTANDLFVGIEAVRSEWASGGSPEAAAERYRERIVGECHRIGEVGERLFERRSRVLTHCNAGALATVEWGTALAPLRVAWERGVRIFVWVGETRPLLQGARLTAWELAQEGIPHAVIADSAAGHFMRRGEIDAVIVGADRIATNGDFANKVGTYEKAVVARENGVPFYVAAPFTTFDPKSRTGASIPIEERGPDEIRSFGGVEVVPPGSPVRNPAFDVTPSRYVTAFITPAGVVSPSRVGRLGAKRYGPPPPRRSPTGRGRRAARRLRG